ncbi:MAG: alpha/beta fold hydrolase [Gemmatimonadota bacterium]
MNRTPVDDDAFAAIAEHFAYDADLPLQARVLSTQTHDGRELPYLTDKVRFRSVCDQEVVGYFAYPREAAGQRVPAVVLLHGMNRYRGSQDTWTRTWLDLLAREGYCVLAIDQYGYGERLVPDQAMIFFSDIRPREGLDMLRQQVVDVRRALDFVRSRPEVDPARVALMGESMGGYHACLAAGLESRIAGLVLVVTGAWPAGAATADPHWRCGHTLNFAPRITTPVLMVYSVHDGREAGQELFDHLPEPRDFVWHDIDDHVILVQDQRPDILPWLARRLK